MTDPGAPRPPRRVPEGAASTVIQPRARSGTPTSRRPRPWYLIPVAIAVIAAGAGTAWIGREWYGSADPKEAERVVGPAVVTVLATTCSGSGHGTGLVIADDRVVTVLSAINGPASVVVVTPAGVVRRVTATSAGADGLAILTVPRLGIAPTRLADRGPGEGSDLIMLGRTDTGVAQQATVTTETAGELTSAVNEASFGGPLVDARNRVAGLVLDRTHIAGPDTLRTYVGLAPSWRPIARGTCQESLGPQVDIPPAYEGPSTSLAEVARLTLTRYVLAVNRHDFEAVHATYAGKLLNQSVSDIAKQHRTTFFINPVIRDVQIFGESGAKVRMTLVSIHAADGPAKQKLGGLTCARWDLSYNLARVDGMLKIQGTGLNDEVLGCDR